jgi:L-ascorbate metabolism protein UlaG (beta-lactamase superfamily)
VQIRWLGWAGLEVAEDHTRLLIDPLLDAAAVYAAAGNRAADAELPALSEPGTEPPRNRCAAHAPASRSR